VINERAEAAEKAATEAAAETSAAAEKVARIEANRRQREANAQRLLARAASRAQDVDGNAEALAQQLGEKTKLSEARADQAREQEQVAKERRLIAAQKAAAEKEAARQRLENPVVPAPVGAAAQPLSLQEKMAAQRAELEVQAEKRWLKNQVRTWYSPLYAFMGCRLSPASCRSLSVCWCRNGEGVFTPGAMRVATVL